MLSSFHMCRTQAESISMRKHEPNDYHIWSSLGLEAARNRLFRPFLQHNRTVERQREGFDPRNNCGPWTSDIRHSCLTRAIKYAYTLVYTLTEKTVGRYI